MKTKFNLKSLTFTDYDGDTQTFLFCHDIINDIFYSQFDNEQLLKIESECIINISSVWDNYNSDEDFNPLSLWMQKVEPIKSVYERIQCYGGSEEGGWHYHNLRLTTLTQEETEESINQYDEGFIFENEIIKGMHENLNRKIYS